MPRARPQEVENALGVERNNFFENRAKRMEKEEKQQSETKDFVKRL